MKLLVIILSRVQALELMLGRFAEEGIRGATILQSTGMARALYDYGQESFMGSLRALFDTTSPENRTIITVLRDEQVPVALRAIEQTVGDLTRPDTGIVFTLPVDFVHGLGGE